MKFSLTVDNCVNVLLPVSLLIYNINWKLGAVAFLGISVLLFFMNQGKICLRNTGLCNTWAVYILVFAVLLQVVRSYQLTISYVVSYILAVLILLMYQSDVLNNNRRNVFYRMFKIIGIIEALSIYLQIILPGIYYKIMGVIAGASTRDAVLKRASEGYYTGFTREVSLTVAFIAICFGILCCEYLFSRETLSINARFFVLIEILIVFGALWLTGKKAQPLFIVASMVLTYIMFSDNKTKFIRIIGIALCGVVLVVIAFPYISKVPSIARIIELIANFLQGQSIERLSSGRTVLYEAALGLWKEQKIWGIGWNNFKNSFDPSYWYYRYDVHNCFLQVLCETGIFGATIFYALILVTTLRILKNTFKTKRIKTKINYKIAFSAYYFIFFTLYSITGTVLYEPSYFLPFFLIIVMNENENRAIRKEEIYEKNTHRRSVLRMS